MTCCRICGDDDGELFHPCKCSGSIRFIHEACLLKWLKLRQEPTCELCGHPFSFDSEVANVCIFRTLMSRLYAEFLVPVALIFLIGVCAETCAKMDHQSGWGVTFLLGCCSRWGGHVCCRSFGVLAQTGVSVLFGVGLLIVPVNIGKLLLGYGDLLHLSLIGLSVLIFSTFLFVAFSYRQHTLAFLLAFLRSSCQLLTPLAVGKLSMQLFVPHFADQLLPVFISGGTISGFIWVTKEIVFRIFVARNIDFDQNFFFNSIIISTCLQVCIVLFALFPSFKLLHFMHILPFVPADSLSLPIPFEIFYAHLFVPLVLNIPPIPRVPSWSVITSNSLKNMIYLALIFTLSASTLAVLLVTAPVLAGRLLCGGADSLVSVLVGILAVLALGQILLRATQTSSLLRRQIAPATIPRGALAICSIAVLLIAGPLLVGLAFQIVFISPLKHATTNVDNNVEETQHVIFPVWVIGLMLIKIVCAIFTMRRTSTVDLLLRQYDLEGILSWNLHVELYTKIAGPVGKSLVLHVFLPQLVAYCVGLTNVVVPLYLGAKVLIEKVIPWLSQQREVVRKKYLMKSKLLNYFHEE